MREKLDLSAWQTPIFYKYIYPVMAKEFLFMFYATDFMVEVKRLFIISERQEIEITKEFDFKERILSD